MFRIFCLAVLSCLTMAVAGQTRSYIDKDNGYSFSYPSTFRLETGKRAAEKGYFTSDGKGTKLVRVLPRVIARKYHGEYEFAIWASDGPAQKCGEPGEDEFNIPIENDKTPKTRSIAGHTFYHYTETDDGMSKTIEMDGYRAYVGKKCWQIQQGVHQASAYDDSRAFNFKNVDREWKAFLDSIRFSK